jgi:hypothetical protein
MVKITQVKTQARRGAQAATVAAGVVLAAVSALAQNHVVLSAVQLVGVLVVVDGVSAWSEPAADVLFGLVVVGATEMWMRGDRHGTTD